MDKQVSSDAVGPAIPRKETWGQKVVSSATAKPWSLSSPVATSLWPPSSRCGSPAAATKSQLGSSRGACTGFWKQETRIGNILWHQFLCKKLLWGRLWVAHLLLEQSMPWLYFQQRMDRTPWFSLPISAFSGCLRMLICS